MSGFAISWLWLVLVVTWSVRGGLGDGLNGQTHVSSAAVLWLLGFFQPVSVRATEAMLCIRVWRFSPGLGLLHLWRGWGCSARGRLCASYQGVVWCLCGPSQSAALEVLTSDGLETQEAMGCPDTISPDTVHGFPELAVTSLRATQCFCPLESCDDDGGDSTPARECLALSCTLTQKHAGRCTAHTPLCTIAESPETTVSTMAARVCGREGDRWKDCLPSFDTSSFKFHQCSSWSLVFLEGLAF